MTDRKVNEDLQRQIDENLKRVFNDQVEDELPERFTSLLEKLRSGQKPRPEDDE